MDRDTIWRHLDGDEIRQLKENCNTASSWDTVLVADGFNPALVRNSQFHGEVRIGRMDDAGLQVGALWLPCGITDSTIRSCDIGDCCAIHNVRYLSHYSIGARCLLFNIEEMAVSEGASFGNAGVGLEIMNEAGCRAVLPFDGMIAADAYLWAKYIDDKDLQQKLEGITRNLAERRSGCRGTVGDGCVIRSARIITDASFGPACSVTGSARLEDVTIDSSAQEPTQIGENVILTNGVVGFGSRILYSCIAQRFIIGNNSNLKYGARMIDSVLGDNSTISCCEVLNNLIFPAHEQHHNNSFLIASCVKGQSNLAAGATVGSNHNSRTNDNEIVAGRGFWPGLCTSVKHSSVFASYTLLAKGAYPAELNIPLPFSMLQNDEKNGELVVFPAFWWLRNMYALSRNSWKYANRDKRITKVQNIEFDTYAPDSMEEAINARKLLEVWTAKAWYKANEISFDKYTDKQLRAKGYELLSGDSTVVDGLEIFGEGMEKSRRKVRIRKVYDAYHAYGDMIIHYAMMNALKYVEANPGETLTSMSARLSGIREEEWVNLGGQIISAADLDRLRADIREGRLVSWEDIHARYDELWECYPLDKLRHAYLSLCCVLKVESMTASDWQNAIDAELRIQNHICDQVYLTRKKDYENPFRRATYRSEEEMLAAIGTLDNNSFVKQIKGETAENLGRLEGLRSRI